MCWGLNSHWFPVVGDGHQPNFVGVYMPIIKNSLLRVGFLVPNIRSLDPTYVFFYEFHHHQTDEVWGLPTSRDVGYPVRHRFFFLGGVLGTTDTEKTRLEHLLGGGFNILYFHLFFCCTKNLLKLLIEGILLRRNAK